MVAANSFKRGIRAVDIFCGAGGLTYGLQKSGINVVAGFDKDPSCEFAFSKNNGSEFVAMDVRDVNESDLRKFWQNAGIRILAGCAPCQTFSALTCKIKGREADERGDLLYSFLDLVRESGPEIVTMENVPQIRRRKVFEDFLKGLRDAGYFVSYFVVFCPSYGIPQTRRRLVLFASKYGEVSLIPASHEPDGYVTARDAIGGLDSISDGGVSSFDPLHRSWRLSKINKKRIRQSRPGGTWLDWDESLVLKCHRKKSGSSYKAVYGRLEWDKPAPTMTTSFFSLGTGRFGHPEQDRALSLREGALIQTFPDSYEFFRKEEDISFEMIGRHIGNAVPVRLGEVIGESILNHLKEAKVRRWEKKKRS